MEDSKINDQKSTGSTKVQNFLDKINGKAKEFEEKSFNNKLNSLRGEVFKYLDDQYQTLTNMISTLEETVRNLEYKLSKVNSVKTKPKSESINDSDDGLLGARDPVVPLSEDSEDSRDSRDSEDVDDTDEIDDTVKAVSKIAKIKQMVSSYSKYKKNKESGDSMKSMSESRRKKRAPFLAELIQDVPSKFADIAEDDETSEPIDSKQIKQISEEKDSEIRSKSPRTSDDSEINNSKETKEPTESDIKRSKEQNLSKPVELKSDGSAEVKEEKDPKENEVSDPLDSHSSDSKKGKDFSTSDDEDEPSKVIPLSNDKEAERKKKLEQLRQAMGIDFAGDKAHNNA